MTLAEAKVGERVRVDGLRGASQADEAIRLGIAPGSEFTVLSKVNQGPVVVQGRVSQIAIGHQLARRIAVSRLA